MPTLLRQYKTGRGSGTPSSSNDVEDFANFFADTLGRMVPATTEEAFYKPQRRGSDGKPRQQDGMVAKVSAKKVKLGKSKSHAGVNRVQNPKTYSKIVKK